MSNPAVVEHRPDATGRAACAAIWALAVVQLLVLTYAHLPQAAGKAFGARLLAYPGLMLLVPVLWFAVTRARRQRLPAPWTAFALIMAPFFVDVSGNTADLYDRVGWWDDANHFANWLLLCAGLGLLLRRGGVRPPWALAITVVGVGAVLAIAWELAEWWTFIRHGTELATAYTDTLGDEALGTAGAATAAMLVTWLGRR